MLCCVVWLLPGKADASALSDVFYEVDDNGEIVEITEEEYIDNVCENVYTDMQDGTIDESVPVMVDAASVEEESINFRIVITVVLILSLIIQIVTMLKV